MNKRRDRLQVLFAIIWLGVGFMAFYSPYPFTRWCCGTLMIAGALYVVVTAISSRMK